MLWQNLEGQVYSVYSNFETGLRMLEPRTTQPLDYLQTKPSNVPLEFSARTYNLLLIISLGGTGILMFYKLIRYSTKFLCDNQWICIGGHLVR